MRGEAHFSDDGVYRYWLEREWDDGGDKGTVVFTMLNPSKAGGLAAGLLVNDPTVIRCVGFARMWGYSRTVIVNPYALVATNPAEIKRHPDPVGPENDGWLRRAYAAADCNVFAWGDSPIDLSARLAVITALVQSAPFCFGKTKAGNPLHPLRLPYTKMLEPWTSDDRVIGSSSEAGKAVRA